MIFRESRPILLENLISFFRFFIGGGGVQIPCTHLNPRIYCIVYKQANIHWYGPFQKSPCNDSWSDQSSHFLSLSGYIDVAHSIGVQNEVLHLFCLQETIYKVLVIFFCFETRGVRSPC